MRNKAIGLAGAILMFAVIATLAAAPHHHFKQDFYVYDTATTDFVIGAIVTVSFSGVTQQAESQRPHGNACFRVPGELSTLDVTVTADGYGTEFRTVNLNGRPNVGGRGFWFGLTPLASVSHAK